MTKYTSMAVLGALLGNTKAENLGTD